MRVRSNFQAFTANSTCVDDMGRDQAAADPKTVHIWVCLIKGSVGTMAARADRQHARTWVKANTSHDGEWQQHGMQEVYHTNGPDTGMMELASLPDAAALIIDES